MARPEREPLELDTVRLERIVREAGETAGWRVLAGDLDTPIRDVRLERAAHEVGQLAEHQHATAPRELRETVAANIGAVGHDLARDTRRARKKLAKNARGTRKELARAAKDATRQARMAGRSGQKTAGEIVAEIDHRATRTRKQALNAARQAHRELAGGRQRQRWPWILLGLTAALAAVASYVAWTGSVLAARSTEAPDAAASPPGTDTTTTDTTPSGARSAAPSSGSTGRAG